MAALVIAAGVWSLATMRVDILPDINKPTVAIFVEADGYAAEEVERLVLAPVEAAVAGTPGVTRIRGTASFGLGIINTEFEWGSDVYRNRQIIQERLTRVQLPAGIKPVFGPVGSIMGEIVWSGLTSDNDKIDGMQLRTLADWTVRPALLKIPGISDVLVMGGDVREWQINLNAERLKQYGMMIADVDEKIKSALNNKGGGYLVQGGKEFPLRIVLAPTAASQLGDIAIGVMDGKPIRLADIATVKEGPSPVRGSASISGKTGVILRIIRQPEAETLKVTEAIDSTLASLAPSLPEGVKVHNDLFRQEWFIHAGLENVIGALRDGGILVVIILILFLMNVRTTLITLTALPLSIFVAAIVFKSFGFSVNVMTLGGLAVAIGELVDDAIVDVENVFHRLREWRKKGKKEPIKQVVFRASSEVRNSIVYATALVVVVFLPIFFIPEVEGKLLASLGFAYLISLIASLVISLSVTPVLCSLFLAKGSDKHEDETSFVKWIKARLNPLIRFSISHVNAAIAVIAIAVTLSGAMYFKAGKEGIPPFNEGSATVLVLMPAGTDLYTSNAYASRIEETLQKIKGVSRVSHITGRAGVDAHESGSNRSEMQVVFEPGMDKNREELFKEIQAVLDQFGGASFSLGQPITHRVEELLSGVRSPVVLKIFGDNTSDMQLTADIILAKLKEVPTMRNPQIQQDVMVPEFRIYVDTNRLSEFGLSSGEVAEELEMGLMGDKVGQIRLGPASVNVVTRFDAESKGTTQSLRDLALPFAGAESLGSAADVKIEAGKNRINHEGGKRTLVVSSNYQGADIVGDVDKVKAAIESTKLPTGVTIAYEGTYKSQKENSKRLAILFVVGLILIFGILYKAFKSTPIVIQVMLNIPTVLIGGMIGVWLTGGVINLAHLIGFISLAGIVSRNGIMLIGRILQMIRVEGHEFSVDTIVRATLDRVVPVLMTSLVTALALIPLIMSGGEPGKELLNPLAVVIFGGLTSSTIVSLFLTPAIFYRFGKKAALSVPKQGDGF